MNIALLLRSNPGGEAGELLFGLLFAVVITYLLNDYMRGLRARANARDHVVEVSRDVLVPDHCVECGRPHASERFRITPRFLGVSPMRQVSDPTIHKDYEFRFCRECAKAMRRHRLAGQAVMAIGALFLLHLALTFVLLFVPPWHDLLEVSPRLAAFCSITSWFVDLVGATVFGLGGLFTWRWSPAVHITDGGGSTILFEFRNQVFRNHFAELNGAT